MSKKQKKNSAGSASTPSTVPSVSARGVIDIDPDLIYFTHSRVRPFFTGCNKRIEDSLEEIVQGFTSIEEIPMITVIPNEGHFFSLNNRRLYLFKSLRALGLIPNNTIKAFAKPPLEREKKRYLVSRCALTAKLMKEHVPGSKPVEGEDQPSSASSASEGEDGEGVGEKEDKKGHDEEGTELNSNSREVSAKKATSKQPLEEKVTRDKNADQHNAKVVKPDKEKKRKGKKGKNAISSDEDEEDEPVSKSEKIANKTEKTVFSKATETSAASTATTTPASNPKKKKGKGNKKDKDDDDLPEKGSRRRRGEEDNSLEKALSHLLVDDDEEEDD